jgi:hypothetical protein
MDDKKYDLVNLIDNIHDTNAPQKFPLSGNLPYLD